MPLRVRIAARAAKQVREAAKWWLENRPGAPGAIAADFAQAITLAAHHPAIGAECAGSRTPGVRRLFLNRVGYFVYYMADDDVLKVLAFWHASRDRRPLL